MNIKKIVLFLLMIAVGQLIFEFWTIDNVIIENVIDSRSGLILLQANAQLAAKFLVITFAVKIAGDFFSKFILKFPGYNWLYIRDYLKEEFFATAGIYLAFALVWLAVSFLVFYVGEVEFLSRVFLGGFLPATFYMFIGTYKFVEKDSAEKRLTRKL
ncbi:MAG: hypothetical protein ACLFPS_02690 [Clostridia bacterium]